MKATLGIEFVGADTYKSMRSMMNFDPRLIGDEFKEMKPSVSEIIGKDEDSKLLRNFLYPKWDYKKANSKGSRGIMLWFILQSDRLYEVSARTSWRNSQRYFCTVNYDGSIYRLNDNEVQEWLSAI